MGSSSGTVMGFSDMMIMAVQAYNNVASGHGLHEIYSTLGLTLVNCDETFGGVL